jgi:hypothetical protein
VICGWRMPGHDEGWQIKGTSGIVYWRRAVAVKEELPDERELYATLIVWAQVEANQQRYDFTHVVSSYSSQTDPSQFYSLLSDWAD